MTEKLNESLSALMDNEADELELRRLLKELENQEADSNATELKAKWERYHVLSASLNSEIHSSPSCNLLAGIQKELENDTAPVVNPFRHTKAGRGLVQILGQGAIAASVALAVLFTADIAMVADNGAGAGLATELADTSGSQLPTLTGELNPSTQTRVAIQTQLDEDEMSRLEQVVSQELEETLREIPATFDPSNTDNATETP